MLIDLIKRCATEAVETNVPVSIVTGTVIQLTPELIIQTDTKLPLDRDFLMFTKYSSELELQVGDKLVLFKIQGGQTYLVLDKVVM